MTLVASGQISLQAVDTELGLASTATISLNDSAARSLAGVPSGQISMSNFYGKSRAIKVSLTINSTTTNYNIFNAAVAANSKVATTATDVTLTINSFTTVYGVYQGLRPFLPNAPIAAVDTGDGWVAGSTITVINNGTIVGWAGDNQQINSGGSGANGNGPNGGPGGDAVAASWPMTFTNLGTVAGGGGQGGFGGNGGNPQGNTSAGVGGHGGVGRGGLATVSGDGGSGGGSGSGVGGNGETGTSSNTALPNDTGFTATNGGRSATITLVAQANTAAGGRAGGGWGQPGGSYTTNGRGRNAGGTLSSLGGQGGAAGKALNGKVYVNSGGGITNGSVYGPQA